MKELTIDALVENLDYVTDFVNEQLIKAKCPPKIRAQIDLCIDEIFGNIAHYTYIAKKGKATVQVEIEHNPRAISLTFIDQGIPFDPLAKEDPDITLSAEERAIGGLGIFMVKKLMDHVSYEFRNGKNILRMKKII